MKFNINCFLARHGQGFHNVKHNENPQLWDDYWSHLNTDGKIVWGPDPELTELGIEQAKDNNIAWTKEIENNINKNKNLIIQQNSSHHHLEDRLIL